MHGGPGFTDEGGLHKDLSPWGFSLTSLKFPDVLSGTNNVGYGFKMV